MKQTITILIAAYNAENRIEKLIDSLKKQKISENYSVKTIVYSDKSSDHTYQIAQKLSDGSLFAKEGSKRLGFGGVLKKHIKENKSDILIILNDDIAIADTNFIENIAKSFKISKKVGLACANIKPLKVEGFIEHAVNSSFLAYRKMSQNFKKGNNLFTVDGKVLVLSKDFCKKLIFPKSMSELGNVDAFLFFSCLNLKFRYEYLHNISVYFTFPSTISDYINWTARNNSNQLILKKLFKDRVDIEYKKPKSFAFLMLNEFMRNPLGCLFVYCLRFLITIKANKVASDFNPLWDTINTSKVLPKF